MNQNRINFFTTSLTLFICVATYAQPRTEYWDKEQTKKHSTNGREYGLSVENHRNAASRDGIPFAALCLIGRRH